MTRENKRLIVIIAAAGGLLSIPFIAMKFTGEVKWSVFDFIVAGILLLCAGSAIEFLLRRVKSNAYRLVLGLAVLIVFLVVWAELAVGLIGTPLAGS